MDDLAQGRFTPGFDELMRFQLDRARGWYAESDGLDALVSPDCRAASLALMRLYRSLLERIAEDPRAVLRGRVSLPWAKKLAIGWRAARGVG
ncbi:MAG: squalene/phytoene synthase family protein, partial [Planctomycetota bacterium]